jgi:hypothetical protein
MSPALVPPSEPGSREAIIAGTKPRSLTRKIRLALFDLGIGRKAPGFPWVMWMRNKKQ